MEALYEEEDTYLVAQGTDQTGANTQFVEMSLFVRVLPQRAFCQNRIVQHKPWPDTWPLGYWTVLHVTGLWLFNAVTLDVMHMGNALIRACMTFVRTIWIGKCCVDPSGQMEEGMPPAAVARINVQDNRRHWMLPRCVKGTYTLSEFIHLFIHLFIYSFIYSFIHSFIHPFSL